MKKMYCVLTLFLLLTLASIAPAAVLYNEWRGTTTDWNTPTNWNLGYVPQIVRGADNIRAGFKGNVAVTAWPIISKAAEAYNVTLGGTTGGSLRLEDGGVFNVGQHFIMGVLSTENGTLYMNGGTINTGVFGATQSAHFFIGQAGKGTVYMNGGTINLPSTSYGNLRIADACSLADGKLYLNAGTIFANDLLMPFAKAGSIDITGGVLQLFGNDTAAVNGFITAGKIITSLEDGTIQVSYNSGTNRTIVSAIPEPATICLLGFGILSLIRRKK